MNYQEFKRLMGYYVAAKRAPRTSKVARRRAKSGNHLGIGAYSKQNATPKGVYPVVTPSSKI